ncbi:MAG: DUF4062 domain-containing protein [Muribaculaceae bacterium]|nr:DUF4062 domain-containing protein [Muribaculaceae bacterium]
MFQANVYKIMVGAPSDVESEVRATFDVIQKWNYINAFSHKLMLLPSHWSLDAYPTLGQKPQKAINNQLVEKSDLLICIFGSKIGTPTDDYISGTVEEIEEHLKESKPVMVFFSNNIDRSKTNIEQINKLLSFQNDMFKRGLCAVYTDLDNFKTLLTEKLALCVNDNFFGLRVLDDDSIKLTPDESNKTSILKKSDIENLKMWVESGVEDAYSIDFIGNSSLILGNKQINLQSSREKVAWNGFFERLLKLDFIEIYGYTNKQNKPKYRLKESAFEFIDSL